MLRELLTPDWSPDSTLPQLSLSELQRRAGRSIGALVIDVDCTLLPHRSAVLPPSAEQWLLEHRALLPIHLFSNNPSEHRIGGLSRRLGLPYTIGAAKPRRGPLRRVIDQLNLPPSQVALLGDRVFTDVLVGNRLGLFTVLVRPIDASGLPDPRDRWQRVERRVARHLVHPLGGSRF